MSLNNISNELKEYVELSTKKLVDNPDDVYVTVTISTKTIIIQIKTNQLDCGKVIGKKGRTVEALKLIVLAIKNTMYPSDPRKIALEIIEEENLNYSYK